MYVSVVLSFETVIDAVHRCRLSFVCIGLPIKVRRIEKNVIIITINDSHVCGCSGNERI